MSPRNGCSLAPPATDAQLCLRVLAEQLEQQAELARRRAQFRLEAVDQDNLPLVERSVHGDQEQG